MIKKIFLQNPKILEEEKKDFIKEFLSLSKKSFFFVGFFSLFINVLMLLPAIYMLAVYDIVVPSRSTPTLLFITILVVVLYIIFGTLQAIRSLILNRINNKFDTFLNKKVLNAMFDFALQYPTKASIQPINDFQQIKQFLTGPTVFAFFDLPWTPIYLFVLYIFHPKYALMGIVVIIIISIITFFNEISTKRALKESNEVQIKHNKFLTYLIRNTEVIEALGMRERIYKKWLKLHYEYLRKLQIASDKNAFWSNLSKTFRTLSQSLMLGLGGYLAIHLEISRGMIVAGSIVLGRALYPIDLLINTWRNFSAARLAYYRLNELLNSFPEKEKPMPFPEPEGAVTLQEVIVVPPESKDPVLQNITMHINPGELVAIIGHNGAGKSSLIRTILGVWTPVSGKVMIDGAEISQWDKEALGRYIGYLPQDIELFEGTVAENIARFEEDYDPEKVIEAAKLAGAHQMILNLPKGYDTYIGPGGITLSGGQRQKIGLARAFYKIPKIIVLDEPDSNLDEAGERAFLAAILELKKKRVTIIVVTHKLYLLRISDKIGMLANGKLVMYGPSAEVLKAIAENRKKTYAQQVQTTKEASRTVN